MVRFGQLVMGPPGSGKTTYCGAMRELVRGRGRECEVVSLDPANDVLPFDTAADLTQLVRLEDIMEARELGPNGALMAAMEYLAGNAGWLGTRLEAVPETTLLLFDLPGQQELLTNSRAIPDLIAFLQKELDVRLVAVNLVDSLYATDAGRFVSVLLASLSAMLHLELPHLNLLSKIRMRKGDFPVPLEALTSELDVEWLLQSLPEDEFLARHSALTTAIGGVITDYSLLRFVAVDVEDEESMCRVLGEADGACGWCYGGGTTSAEGLLSAAMPPPDAPPAERPGPHLPTARSPTGQPPTSPS